MKTFLPEGVVQEADDIEDYNTSESDTDEEGIEDETDVNNIQHAD